MCVVTMVMDHYTDKWNQLPQSPYIGTVLPKINEEEIAEFKRLLELARECDKRNSEPECELEEKKETLRRLAKQFGVEITFL